MIKKIERCGLELTQWSRKNFGHVRRELVEKRKWLVKVEHEARQNGSNHRVRELKMEINELLVKENTMWRQRAKALWLAEGDMNSRYFHSQATQRFQRNRILVIQNSVGTWVAHPDDVGKAFTIFYQDLFASSNPSNEVSSLD